MARKFICDRCSAQFDVFKTDYVTFPSGGWCASRTVELCPDCLKQLAVIIDKFMKG